MCALGNAMFKKYRKLNRRIRQQAAEDRIRDAGASIAFAIRKPVYFTSEKLGIAYLQIPKTGCSSILALILEAERPDFFERVKDDLKKSVSLLHHTPDLFETCKTPAPHLIRFAFVRHPFDRVLSFYKNQVNPGKQLTPELKILLREQLGRHGFQLGMSFDEFTRRLASGRQAIEEPHVRPQCEFLFGEAGLNVDYIGKLEEIARHRTLLGRMIGQPELKLMKLNATGGAGYLESRLMTDEILSRLEKLYTQDFGLLGYRP